MLFLGNLIMRYEPIRSGMSLHNSSCHHTQIFTRKDKLSPEEAITSLQQPSPRLTAANTGRAFLFASLQKCRYRVLRAGLTLEAAIVMPVFLVCCAAVLHYGNVLGTVTRIGTAMTQTCEEMAAGAYAAAYGDTDSILAVALTAAYARTRTFSMSGDRSAIRTENFLLSDYLEDDRINLVMTYRVRPVVGIVHTPGNFFVQRACTRAWTGRKGSGGTEEAGGEEVGHQTVYVTQHGKVYHTDANCSHIHLNIKKVSKAAAAKQRNEYGERYRRCEHCGGGSGDSVYITTDGNRYHSSLTCSGLTRTVREEELKDVEGSLRPCSGCAGKHSKED